MRKLLVLSAIVGLIAVAAAVPGASAKTSQAPRTVAAATCANTNFAQNFCSVSCPAATVRSGGGIFGFSSSTLQSVNSSYPIGNGWAGFMNNRTGANSSFTVYAVCLTG